MSTSQRTGILFVIVGNILFSAKAIFAKLIYPYGVDATTLMTLRLGFSFPFFAMAAIWAWWKKSDFRLSAQDWRKLSLFAFLGYYGASFLNFLGLKTVSAGLERLILFTYPTIVVVLSSLFRKIPITRQQGLALILTYGGIALVLVPGLRESAEMGWGALLILGSSIFFASYLLLVGDTIARLGSMLYTSLIMMIAGSMTFIHFTLTRSLADLEWPMEVYLLFLGLSIFSTVIPVFLISEGIRRLGASNTAIIASIGPVATIVLAFFFLHEPITAIQLAGTALVLIGVWQVSKRSDRPLADTPVRVR
ncbi:MAG: DMT family transporter [Saprospiraceae bacterium]|nr:DMT family transporter [Saprospiraceae bacterium]